MLPMVSKIRIDAIKPLLTNHGPILCAPGYRAKVGGYSQRVIAETPKLDDQSGLG